MSHEHDSLHEPLRLLRESSLAAGFEERLATRLAVAHPERIAPVLRFPGRKRTLIILAAIALPAAAAAAAAAGYYWSHHRSATNSTVGETRPTLESHVTVPPRVAVSVTPAPEESAEPVLEDLNIGQPARFPQQARADKRVKAETQISSRASKPAVVAPTNVSPRIESLDVVVPRKASSGQSATVAKGISAGDNLHKATEEGAGRQLDDSVRGSRRGVDSNGVRGNDVAGQARERGQVRERKGQ